jgi:Na+-transporting methylmalonyl-CoA/oxaloacetate decarboxylase gamma subunit
MGVGMGVVFITLAIFFIMIVVLERLFKNEVEKRGDE